MDTYDVELEEAEGRFIGTVRAMPGLLVFGASVDEALERVRSAIDFQAGCPSAVHEPIGVAEAAQHTSHIAAET